MRFRGNYNFLSNFFELPEAIEHDGKKFFTVEHAYQYAKAKRGSDKAKIILADTPTQAKRIGKHCEAIPDWNSKKYAIMVDLIRKKFSIPSMKERLLAVEEPIIEHNTWGDTYWGVCGGQGKNNLGKIITTVRQELLLFDNSWLHYE